MKELVVGMEKEEKPILSLGLVITAVLIAFTLTCLLQQPCKLVSSFFLH
jgi:hypothetical protein